jgi:hypothetical protein
MEARRYTDGELAAAKKLDMKMFKRRAALGDARIGKTGRLRGQVSTTAFFNAVNQEGPEVATAAGNEYWRDQERLHPWIGDGRGGGPVTSANGMVNRFGRVKEKLIFRGGQVVSVRMDARGRLVEESRPQGLRPKPNRRSA